MTVKYLSDLGYLKTSNQVAEQFKEKADTITQDVKDMRDDIKDRHDKFKDEWADAWQKFAEKRRKKQTKMTHMTQLHSDICGSNKVQD